MNNTEITDEQRAAQREHLCRNFDEKKGTALIAVCEAMFGNPIIAMEHLAMAMLGLSPSPQVAFGILGAALAELAAQVEQLRDEESRIILPNRGH
jgi:hypothetical protein